MTMRKSFQGQGRRVKLSAATHCWTEPGWPQLSGALTSPAGCSDDWGRAGLRGLEAHAGASPAESAVQPQECAAPERPLQHLDPDLQSLLLEQRFPAQHLLALQTASVHERQHCFTWAQKPPQWGSCFSSVRLQCITMLPLLICQSGTDTARCRAGADARCLTCAQEWQGAHRQANTRAEPACTPPGRILPLNMSRSRQDEPRNRGGSPPCSHTLCRTPAGMFKKSSLHHTLYFNAVSCPGTTPIITVFQCYQEWTRPVPFRAFRGPGGSPRHAFSDNSCA
jgi:hypothetical protein